MRNLLRATGLLACVWLSYTLGALLEAHRSERSLFEGVRSVVGEHFVDTIDTDSLTFAGIRGVFRYLDDPYASILGPDEYARFKEDVDGQFGGIGTQIQIRREGLTIVSPKPGEPAAQAGIRAGDRVVAIDGRPTDGWNTQDAVAALRGEPGSDVTLTVRRGEDTLNIRIQRDTIQVSAVGAAALLEDGIGYVALEMFTTNAARQLEQAIDSLLAEGASALVLDLRSNPGGLLEQALAVANLFLPEGTLLAEVRGRDARLNTQFHAMRPARYPDLPVALVTNGATASAAEIVVGALRDHGRAQVFGTRTFGKGSIQTLFPLPQSHVIRLTTARWYTPAGFSIDGERGEHGGIAPDVVVAEPMWHVVDRMLQEHDADWNQLADRVYWAAIEVANGRATTDEVAAELVAEIGIAPPDAATVQMWLEQHIELELELLRFGSQAARIFEARMAAAVQVAVDSLR